jgi:hypothetical protein
MTDFEDQLRRALERKEPSADFAARVVARAALPRGRAPWFNPLAWASAGIAASLLVGAMSLDLGRREKTRQQGEEARAQLIQAMQITSTQLDKIHKKVQGVLR